MRLRPARNIAAAAAAVLAAAVCIRLGLWQLDRLESRRAANAQIEGALSLPPLELEGANLPALRADPDAHTYQRTRATGRYRGEEIILRGRAFTGRPGIHLVTPLELSDGTLVLVNRGWVPSPDAATIDPVPLRRSGVVRVEGVLQRIPDAGAEAEPAPLDAGAVTVPTFRRLDYTTLVERYGPSLLPVYLQESPSDLASSTPPVAIPLPTLDEGPHLSYALQWFSFAAIALIGPLVVLFLRRRSPH